MICSWGIPAVGHIVFGSDYHFRWCRALLGGRGLAVSATAGAPGSLAVVDSAFASRRALSMGRVPATPWRTTAASRTEPRAARSWLPHPGRGLCSLRLRVTRATAPAPRAPAGRRHLLRGRRLLRDV
jgi:hypothetical protein